MSFRHHVEKQDNSRLIGRLARLTNLVKLNAPSPFIADALAFVVVTSRYLLGREIVDRALDDCQSSFDASQAGLCIECRREPAQEGLIVCERCQQEIEKSEKNFIYQELMDQPPKGPIN